MAAFVASAVTAIITFYGVLLVTRHRPDLTAKNVEFLNTKLSAPLIVFFLINPWYEELIARAYLMTESFFLLGEKDAAVLLSVILQTSYHLYQGIPAALSIASIFLVFSLY